MLGPGPAPPQAPEFGGVTLWQWDAATASLGLSDQDPIVSWVDDKQGVALSSSTGSRRPVWHAEYDSDGAAAVYDGSDDESRTVPTHPVLAQPFFVALVVHLLVPTGTQSIFGEAATPTACVLYRDGTPRLSLLAGGSGFSTTAPIGASPLIGATFNGASSRIYQGGAQTGAGSINAATNLNGFALASPRVFGFAGNVAIHEVLLYSAALDDDQRTSVWDYLTIKWGL